MEGLVVVAGVADGDSEAPAAQPPSRNVTARPTTSRTAVPRAFIPVLLWDACESPGASESAPSLREGTGRDGQ
jgi:hypothetical protein